MHDINIGVESDITSVYCGVSDISDCVTLDFNIVEQSTNVKDLIYLTTILFQVAFFMLVT